MRVWKLKPYGSTGIFARQSRNDGAAPKGVRGQQRTGDHVPLSLLKSSQMQARPLVSRPLFSVHEINRNKVETLKNKRKFSPVFCCGCRTCRILGTVIVAQPKRNLNTSDLSSSTHTNQPSLRQQAIFQPAPSPTPTSTFPIPILSTS